LQHVAALATYVTLKSFLCSASSRLFKAVAADEASSVVYARFAIMILSCS
jgi:hypothetical protein